MWAQKLRHSWANAEFEAYGLRNQALDAFWATVRRGRVVDGTFNVPPTIAYGDGQFAAAAAGRRAAPTCAVYLSCCKVMGQSHVRLATEHRSTKTCSTCGTVMQRVRSTVPPARHRYVPRHLWHDTYLLRGLLRCPNKDCGHADKPGGIAHEHCVRLPGGAGAFVHRDIYAAVNILQAYLCLLDGQGVPVHMQRGPHVVLPTRVISSD